MQAHSAIHPITCNNGEHAINPYHPELVQGQEPEPSQLRERSGRERGGHVDYVMVNSHTTSHSTTLNLILSPDPDHPEQSGLLKGGGGREGWNMWVILYMHNINSHTTSLSTTLNLILSPEPLQRTSSCAEIKQKMFKHQNK